MIAQGSETSAHGSGTTASKIFALLGRLCSLASVRGTDRKLRLCESLSFGEKRFIAVVEYGQRKFLLAGTPQNISLLQRLDEDAGRTDQEAALEMEREKNKPC